MNGGLERWADRSLEEQRGGWKDGRLGGWGVNGQMQRTQFHHLWNGANGIPPPSQEHLGLCLVWYTCSTNVSCPCPRHANGLSLAGAVSLTWSAHLPGPASSLCPPLGTTLPGLRSPSCLLHLLIHSTEPYDTLLWARPCAQGDRTVWC